MLSPSFEATTPAKNGTERASSTAPRGGSPGQSRFDNAERLGFCWESQAVAHDLLPEMLEMDQFASMVRMAHANSVDGAPIAVVFALEPDDSAAEALVAEGCIRLGATAWFCAIVPSVGKTYASFDAMCRGSKRHMIWAGAAEFDSDGRPVFKVARL